MKSAWEEAPQSKSPCNKIPSKMEVAPSYKLLTLMALLTLLIWFTLLTLFILFKLY